MLSKKEFEKLFKSNYKRFVSIAYGYTHQREVAEEVVQDVFVDFWSRVQRNENILNNEAYLRKAIVYRSLNERKKERKHSEKENVAVLDQIVSASDSNPEDYIIGKERLSHLKDQINCLPDKTRHVFMLSRFEKMSYKEISEQTNITVKTVEYHITKALSILRNALFTGLLIIINIFL